jgi:hypothetical protein
MNSNNLFVFDKVGDFLKEVSLKIRDREQRYVWVPIKTLGFNIPIWEAPREYGERILIDFIERRYGNDLNMAKSNVSMWKGHVVSQCVPNCEKLFEALADGSYLNAYSENIIITSIYLETIALNPHLDWNNLCWPKDPKMEKQKEVSKKILSSLDLLRTVWTTDCAVGGAAVKKEFDKLIKSIQNFSETA